MKFKIKAYNLQELGQRENQEDSLFPVLGKSTSDDRLFVLCDGMGGHEKGEVASSTVCEVMSKTILSLWNPTQPLSDELFQQALSAAYDALDAKDNGEERKMGTTLTFLCLHANGATVAHVGDSRVYQLRPATKKSPARIVFRTQDHSLVNDLVKIGEITEEEAKHHPQKNVITRAMQPCQEHRAKADIAHLTDIQVGDYFYMCSDGMLEEASDENILNIITKPNVTDDRKLEMLRQVTIDNKDNHTAHLIYIGNVEGNKIAKVINQQSPANGVLINPEFSAPRKKHNAWVWWFFGILIIVAITATASFVVLRGREKAKNLFGTDSVKDNPTMIRPIESQPATNSDGKFTQPFQKPMDGDSFNKPQLGKTDRKNESQEQKVSQPATKKDSAKHNVLNKIVEQAQSTKNENKEKKTKKEEIDEINYHQL